MLLVELVRRSAAEEGGEGDVSGTTAVEAEEELVEVGPEMPR